MLQWAIFASAIAAILLFALKEPVKEWLKKRGINLDSTELNDAKEHLIDSVESAAKGIKDHVSIAVRSKGGNLAAWGEAEIKLLAEAVANELAVIAQRGLSPAKPKSIEVTDPVEMRKRVVSQIEDLQSKLRAYDEAEARAKVVLSEALK